MELGKSGDGTLITTSITDLKFYRNSNSNGESNTGAEAKLAQP